MGAEDAGHRTGEFGIKNRANGLSEIEGKAAREAASEWGRERVSMEPTGESDIEHVAIGNRAGRRLRS